MGKSTQVVHRGRAVLGFFPASFQIKKGKLGLVDITEVECKNSDLYNLL